MTKEWESANTDLVQLLQSMKGRVKRKLEKVEDIIYNYGAERFGVRDKTIEEKLTNPVHVKKTVGNSEIGQRKTTAEKAMKQSYRSGKRGNQHSAGRAKTVHFIIALNGKPEKTAQEKERTGPGF